MTRISSSGNIMRNLRPSTNPRLRPLQPSPPGRWAVGGAALLALLAPAGSSGQTRTSDEGTLRVRIGAVEVAREEFTILQDRAAGGATRFRLSATAFYPPRRTRVTHRPSVEFGPDSLPRVARFDPSAGHDVTVVAQFGGRLFTLRRLDAGGESFREYPGVARNWVVDDSVTSLYAVPPGTADGPVRLVEARRGAWLDYQLTNRGREETDVLGRSRPLRHLVLTRGDDTRHLWYDDAWRLMKVEIPARHLVAERMLEPTLPNR